MTAWTDSLICLLYGNLAIERWAHAALRTSDGLNALAKDSPVDRDTPHFERAGDTGSLRALEAAARETRAPKPRLCNAVRNPARVGRTHVGLLGDEHRVERFEQGNWSFIPFRCPYNAHVQRRGARRAPCASKARDVRTDRWNGLFGGCSRLDFPAVDCGGVAESGSSGAPRISRHSLVNDDGVDIAPVPLPLPALAGSRCIAFDPRGRRLRGQNIEAMWASRISGGGIGTTAFACGK